MSATIYSDDPEKTRKTMVDGAQDAYIKRTKVPGSGRKASGAAPRNVSFPTRVSQPVADYLTTMGKTRGEQIENAVRELVRLREDLQTMVSDASYPCTIPKTDLQALLNRE